jgi:hypothetical protein
MIDGTKKKPTLKSKSSSAQSSNENLLITPSTGAALSKAQIDFNKLMQRLENARIKYQKKEARLDQNLTIVIRDLYPLLEEFNRVSRDIALTARQALDTNKLTAKRRRWFADLISEKASDLLGDPVGLSDEDITTLEKIIEELGISEDTKQLNEEDAESFAILREMVERRAKIAGVDIDLSDLDVNSSPADLERILYQRFSEAMDAAKEKDPVTPGKSGRKPTKAQLEKERKQQEREEAKNRDFKSLYKQLAKALHPDLETDPDMKLHKETWMKRLTTAYKNGDLRDMLQIEMEWLGEEATNLASASDDKLRVYSSVLKEQIEELKFKTDVLVDLPQYRPILRFLDPYSGEMYPPAEIKINYKHNIAKFKKMLAILAAGDAEARNLIHQWADSHGSGRR